MIRRVAYLSVHASPLALPGIGDAGGMNVYIDELSRTMAGRGIAVDVFTRKLEPAQEEVVTVSPGYRVVHLDAGPPGPVTAGELAEVVGAFAEGVVKLTYREGVRYDVVHSHYWLSGWAGVLVKEALGIPLANSFHTLGRIKDAGRRWDEAPSGLLRIRTEHGVVAQSDCVIASTPAEAQDLIDHYDAPPERLCVSPPGVDHQAFTPGDRRLARRRLGLPGTDPIVLVAGRIQPLKGVDTAIRVIASPHLSGVRLLIVGGPSGPMGSDEIDRLRRLAAEVGIDERVHMRDPVPHRELVNHYRAADAVLVPSRSESFGMVAVEAQACGIPVVAASVGGLRFVVKPGVSGFLVADSAVDDYARSLAAILEDAELAARLGAGARRHAANFNWDATADRLLEMYGGMTE